MELGPLDHGRLTRTSRSEPVSSMRADGPASQPEQWRWYPLLKGERPFPLGWSSIFSPKKCIINHTQKRDSRYNPGNTKI